MKNSMNCGLMIWQPYLTLFRDRWHTPGAAYGRKEDCGAGRGEARKSQLQGSLPARREGVILWGPRLSTVSWIFDVYFWIRLIYHDLPFLETICELD